VQSVECDRRRGGVRSALLLLAAGGPKGKSDITQPKCELKVDKEPFGTTPDGQQIDLYHLVNANGMKVDIINYGAIVVRLMVPDRNGRLDDVVLATTGWRTTLRTAHTSGPSSAVTAIASPTASSPGRCRIPARA